MEAKPRRESPIAGWAVAGIEERRRAEVSHRDHAGENSCARPVRSGTGLLGLDGRQAGVYSQGSEGQNGNSG
jgi:hypothetical protein